MTDKRPLLSDYLDRGRSSDESRRQAMIDSVTRGLSEKSRQRLVIKTINAGLPLLKKHVAKSPVEIFNSRTPLIMSRKSGPKILSVIGGWPLCLIRPTSSSGNQDLTPDYTLVATENNQLGVVNFRFIDRAYRIGSHGLHDVNNFEQLESGIDPQHHRVSPGLVGDGIRELLASAGIEFVPPEN